MQATTTLSPDEWKQLALLNVGQLQGYLQSIPSMAGEAGTSGLTDEHLALIDAHVARGKSFLVAWRKSKAVDLTAQSQPTKQVTPQRNGADAPKRRGGWPLGKKRKSKPSAQQSSQ